MALEVHADFLRLTGFEEDEIAPYLSDWIVASEKLGLTADDIKFATESWIPNHFDIKLKGVRKALGALIKETVDLTKSNEYRENGVKIVYGILPAILDYYYALKITAPTKVYVSFPDLFLAFTLNIIFHKLNRYLEDAERSGISYGCRHCALNKTRYAARLRGLIPSPHISWIWGFICDEGPKTDEFIQLYHDSDWKTYITRLPHDQPLGTVEDENVDRVRYLASQMKDGFKFVQSVIGVKVPIEKIKEAQKIRQRYMSKIAELNRLMVVDPQPLGGASARLFGGPVSTPFNTGIEEMERALDIIIHELKQRVARREGILPLGAPRLMAWMIPVCVPWVAKIFEENSVGLTFSQYAMLTKKQLEPTSFDDPYMAAAEAWLRQGFAVNPGYEAEQILEKMEKHKVDGIVFGFLDFDRWLGSAHRLLAKIVQERTKVPVFYIEGDLWEDRDYSPEALRTRIESICAMVKMRKAG